MSAQTKTAPELRPYRNFPTTPVIIKVGGGEGDPDAQSAVEISSDFMPFLETVPGLTWETSQSTLTGRITELVIRDGSKPVAFPQSHPDQLAAVRIKYGSNQVVLMESGDPLTNNVVLVIVSEETPFNVTTEPEWSAATTRFSAPPESVRFTAGDTLILEHSFVTADPKLLVNFNLNIFDN